MEMNEEAIGNEQKSVSEKEVADNHVEAGVDVIEARGDDASVEVKNGNKTIDLPIPVKEDGPESCGGIQCRYPREPSTRQLITAGVVLGLAAVGACTIVNAVSDFFSDDDDD